MTTTPRLALTVTLDEDVWREVAHCLEAATPEERVRSSSLKEANSIFARDRAIRAIRVVVPKRKKRTTAAAVERTTEVGDQTDLTLTADGA